MVLIILFNNLDLMSVIFAIILCFQDFHFWETENTDTCTFSGWRRQDEYLFGKKQGKGEESEAECDTGNRFSSRR